MIPEKGSKIRATNYLRWAEERACVYVKIFMKEVIKSEMKIIISGSYTRWREQFSSCLIACTSAVAISVKTHKFCNFIFINIEY